MPSLRVPFRVARYPSKATAYVKAVKSGRSVAAARSRSSYTSAPRSSGGKEKKVIDLAEANYAVNTTGSVTALNLVAQGTDYTDRIGRIIKPVSVQVRGTFLGEDATTLDQLGRVMLVWDSQPNGATIATIAQILNAATSTSFNNLQNRDRFKIIRDEMVNLGGVDTTATQTYASKGPENINWYVPLGNDYVTQYNTTTGVIAAVSHGALLLVTIGSNATTAGHLFKASTRVRFTDN